MTGPLFDKILIANRGEIACRIIRTCRRLGIKCVAVYSDIDANAMHVRLADEAVHIGPSPSAESYLKADTIIKAAKQTGAQAIHPGYGFLSENAAFAKSCAKAGIVFIGPSEKSILAMGLKDKAKAIMDEAVVPIVPGYQGDNQDVKFLQEQADKIGYPLLIKAVAGGGGKGMRLVERSEDFEAALGNAQREGKASFGNDHVLLEKYITKPRHIEVQVFGDTKGNVVHLFERDCSLQRRHQKVVEEAPAPGLSEDMRSAMGDAAVKAAKAIDYYGAGTIEFIVDVSGGIQNAPFYFMEMNTRLQVEHPVTEMITGQDLVEWQLRVAAGETLPLNQNELHVNGHAFEVRLYAEDPAQNFLPQTGRITVFNVDNKTGNMRVDSGVEAGDQVSAFYDPMIAKLIAYGETRDDAARHMSKLLAQTYLCGLNTNQEFLSNIFDHSRFLSGDVDTGFIEAEKTQLMPEHYGTGSDAEFGCLALYLCLGLDTEKDGKSDPWASSDNWRFGMAARRQIAGHAGGASFHFTATCHAKTVTFDNAGTGISATLVSFDDGVVVADVNGQKVSAKIIRHKDTVSIFCSGRVCHVHLRSGDAGDDADQTGGPITAPMPGLVVRVMVQSGDNVTKDQPLLIIESMKVEMTIRSKCNGKVTALPVAEKDLVSEGTILVDVEEDEQKQASA